MNRYPDTWGKSTLDQFGEVVSGGTPDRNNPAYWKGEIPWVTPSEITTNTGKYLYDTREKITKAGLNASSAKLLPVNSLLITSRATLGEIAIAAIPVSTNQGFKSIILNNETDPVYAYYLIKTLKGEMVRLSSGTTFLEISKGDFSRIIAHRPELLEQTRIAYALDTIDEAIAATEAVIAKLMQVRAGMLHDLLSYGLDEHGQLRDPIAHPEQFKDSPLGRIPRAWDVVKLGEALSMQAGNILSSENIAGNGQYPVYGGNGIRGYTSTFTHEGLFALIGRQGALCGNIIVASGKFYATEHAVVVTPKERMNVGWLASYLTAMDLNRFSESSAQPGLSVQKISHHRIKIPKLSEQEAINLCLKAIDKQLASELDEVQKYKSLKSGLQDDLLTGRVRVTESIREGAAGV